MDILIPLPRKRSPSWQKWSERLALVGSLHSWLDEANSFFLVWAAAGKRARDTGSFSVNCLQCRSIIMYQAKRGGLKVPGVGGITLAS
jgi:hypothetical protein